MDIAKNLRRLRVINGATQENLAKFLGISYQAISKWERGESYPDITLLPAIARFFNTSVDELIGTEKALRDQRFQELRDNINRDLSPVASVTAQMAEAGMADPLPTGEELEKAKETAAETIRAGIRTFPDDYEILITCANALSVITGTDEKYKREAVAVLEHIIRTCTESKWRTWAEFQLSSLLARLGEMDRAYAIADLLPDVTATRLRVKAVISTGRGDEHVRFIQETILQLSGELYQMLLYLARAADGGDAFGRGGTEVFSIDEKYEIYDVMIGLFDYLYGKVIHPYAVEMYNMCFTQVFTAMTEGRHEKALDYIEKIVEYAAVSEGKTVKDDFKGVLADRIDFDSMWGSAPPEHPLRKPARHCQFYLMNFTHNAQALEPISGDPRFLAAMEKLRQHAGSDNN